VTPVLDQMAEGWGTMTVKPDQHALGKGVWKAGVWRVVITRPMVSDDLNAPRLLPGNRTVAAFAVWDGGNREVGARKAWASWVPLVIQR
jgi:DMSO reductase family type II enzyme heme b subunit